MTDQISWFSAALKSVKQLFSSAPYKSPIQPCPIKPIVGTKWQNDASAVFPGQQSYQNCGIQSVRQLVEQARHECLKDTELEFLEKAIKTCGAETGDPHPGDSGGTSAVTRQCILKHFGVESGVQDASMENVDAALRSGKGVIISADVSVLWKDQAGVAAQSGRHAVVLTHGAYDADGNLLGVYVNDTGINKRYYLTTGELSDVLESGSGSINVTDRRIWPANE